MGPKVQKWAKMTRPQNGPKNVFQSPISSFFAWSQRAFSGDNRLSNQLEATRKIRKSIFSQNVPFWQKSIKFAKKAPKKGEKSCFWKKSPQRRVPEKSTWKEINSDFDRSRRALVEGNRDSGAASTSVGKVWPTSKKWVQNLEKGKNSPQNWTLFFCKLMPDFSVFEQISKSSSWGEKRLSKKSKN